MDILLAAVNWFSKTILSQPAWIIGFIVVIGYCLLGKKWYEVLAGFIKASVGYMILSVGSGGLISSFRPITVGLSQRFNLSAMVIDPYFGNNAVDAGVKAAAAGNGPAFLANANVSQYMLLLLFAYILNILLVALKRYTKLRAIFTTGNVQVQQAATALWLIMFCFPSLMSVPALVVMTILLGLYWAVGSNLTIGPAQELTEGAGFAIGHQQMFGIFLASKAAGWMRKRDEIRQAKNPGKTSIFDKKLEDIELPGWLSMFNENMVSTALLMTLFFGIILIVIGPDFLIKLSDKDQTAATYLLTGNAALKAGKSFVFYIMYNCFQFAVYLTILQLGVRTFVAELTVSFQGISNKLLKGSVPGVDCAVTFGFGSTNAVTLGFMAGAIGQFIAIAVLILIKSPVLVVAGFIPLFFDNATLGVFANNKGGLKACLIIPFICGLCQVFGSALIASWVQMYQYGGYLGMFDWAVVWPLFTVIMKYAGWIGIAIVAVFLLIIPQLQYRSAPKDENGESAYFLEVEDYDKYAELRDAALAKQVADAAK
ncbi:PTS ascorbate transporter subunit IIC [Olsenella sp. HMSC062G07]|uniref:PTS ascorbate transporter subunit IIC n=1 Tax=Olsenella sp. HMSC062G07 TaxID=1739330 RepID=UPI0008A23EE0|nr:PTS ascorbate transporter subunit IIC [Olsenella sp. HMSC062G07]OFK24968.1 PTS ascorbate transporter subunit IIC [Olsenella sp. HMSC062G07]